METAFMQHFRAVFAWLVFPAAMAAELPAQPVPIAHWPLATDARDATGRGHDGIAHNITWNAGGSAEFNGRNGFIEIPDHLDLALGTTPFALVGWVYTDKGLDDAIGDIAAKFDPATRKGLTLSIMNYPGVTSGQPNWRNLAFGIDDAKITQPWADCGRPGNCRMVFALCVWRDSLYAATFELDADQAGHVYRYAGGTRWEDCGSPDTANAVTTLAVFEGRLYAGTACYDSVGSSLPPSPNKNPGGKVYRHESPSKWTCCGQLQNPRNGVADTVHSLTVYRSKLYATTIYKAGSGLYEYEAGSRWRCLGDPGCRVEVLGVYNGDIYTTSYDGPGRVARWHPSRGWQDLGAPPETMQTYAFMPYEGHLWLATWPKATVYRLDQSDRWAYQGRLGEENETMAMVVYNGKLYAGSLPLAKVYRHDGGTTWTEIGWLDSTPDIRYRRVWSMAVYKGKLFAGTMPSGHVWSFEAGCNVTCDHEFPPDWHHVAAVRDDSQLRLYVDGLLVTRSRSFKPGDLDLSNGAPLRIGIGSHDYFRGRLADLGFYRVALSDDTIAELARRRPAPPGSP
ncbi:MAG: LamG domain-containing protein [Phycisphaerae bacterium]|nr:LamG domain-containing protein [Phycisphaerae bacterium]